VVCLKANRAVRNISVGLGEVERTSPIFFQVFVNRGDTFERDELDNVRKTVEGSVGHQAARNE
jgi:hypothetical protein